MKLLAKTAEDRYQTTAGLTSDLRHCLAEWEATGRIEPFPPGAHDASDRLRIPEKLYGREREIASLLKVFDRVVANATPELVLVSGYAGIGKSSVVNELHKALVPPRGLFASGKFDQYKRNIPYASLAQAFQGLVRPILSQSEAELGRWRDALSDALGPNGQLIVNLVPELELVVGNQPAVAELPPQDAQRRFQMVFRRLLGVFASKEHPLALFVDDLQWLDTATLDLLEHLVTHPEVRHLLLVGAYRDNEAGPAHPLLRTLEAVRDADVRVHRIVLAPLGLDDVCRLVADALHSEPQRAQPLAQLVHQKTGGNPFFAIQFFTALSEEGLVAFDPVALIWQWDMDRIRAQRYTDNVVDLMAGKLKRLSTTTQEALKQLACLGNVAEIATLALVRGETHEATHGAFREAVHAGLVFREDGAYKFLHDRIQQAAYTLIPAEHRAEVHVRIGRVLVASMTAGELAEHLFDVANQFNRGSALLVDPDEKAQVATIELGAGRKAKASTAWESACGYLAAGEALLDESDWGSRYQLAFSLWVELAECEFLSGNFGKAEQLVGELLRRAASKVDRAAVYHLKIQLHEVKGEYLQAVDSALTCLRLFDIDAPAHPPWEQVQAEYEAVWRNLEGRAIENLVDLPLMTDPELQAAMRLLSALQPAAYYTDFHSFCLHLCRMVNFSMQHGTSGASAHAFGYFGFILGPVFHRYGEGYRFTKLACDLVEKHGFIAYQAKVHYLMGRVAFWTQPIASALEFFRAAFRTATETGDLTYACYSMCMTLAALLLRNDPLGEVWRESENGPDPALMARFRDGADMIVSQQRFIATMQGRTSTFSTFSDAQFDEAAFEAQLAGDRMPTMICLYWILKLKARFLSGDYAAALAAADKAKALLWAAAAQIQLIDYSYYSALTVAALYENASADEQAGWRDLLKGHQKQLGEWAENYPPTFGDKYALVSAEIAHLEGRDLDAMRLYEQAIQLARENGFVQNEGLAQEVAAQFYAVRGFETIAHAYLQSARNCYLRWGAEGKVRRLNELHPSLRESLIAVSPTATVGTAIEQLDVETVLRAAQAVSGEILLGKLIETLLRIAVEHAGAGRGLLILFRSDEPWIEAEATTAGGQVLVTLRQTAVSPVALPGSVLHYVIRTRESVILNDAAVPTMFSADIYVQQRRPRSVLCLPLVKQAKLVGALYLENNLTPSAFTSDRIAVLELLASQAAISLENAVLYSDLQQENADRMQAEKKLRQSEAFLAEGQRISHTGSWSWNISTGKLVWSEEHYRIFGFDPKDTEPTFQLLLERIHAEDRSVFQQILDEAIRERTGLTCEFRIILPDGSIKYLHGVGRPVLRPAADPDEYIGTTMDITERKRREEALRNAQTNLRQLESDLAHVNRLSLMGELAASLIHEVTQPIATAGNNARAALNFLARTPPELDEVRESVNCVVGDTDRAGEIIDRMRQNIKKAPPRKDAFDLNEAIKEVLQLVQSAVSKHQVSVKIHLKKGSLPVEGDRVQLQQVLLNLILNALESMSSLEAGVRELLISTMQSGAGDVLVAVCDSGAGIGRDNLERVFEAFYTTKSNGVGMGLSICRSIVNAHGGRLWSEVNEPTGAKFQFTLPSRKQGATG